MSERFRSENSARYQTETNSAKMSEGDLGTRKTLFVLVIVVGCFAVLWPKVFYPMLVGPTNQRMKPSNLDKGCCDVISDIDVNTIKIMSELCNNIIQQDDEKPLKGQEIIIRCRAEVLNKCGIDISAVLQEQVRLGHSFKQIVDEVRSFNGSLCLKYNFGVSPWRLGVSHRVVNLGPAYIRQERPAHLRPEMLHPALREKGRAIPQPYQPPGKGSQPKFVDGRPGPVPGVRPPMGGAGHVVHPQQKGLNSMGVIMPIYTIGIVIFFSYTLMKLLFKKKPEGPGGGLYPPVEPSMTFRREVFESQKSRAPHGPGSIVNAMSALLDEVDQELEARRKANEAASQKEEPTSNGTLLANGDAKQPEHEQPSVKVLGMEMTASCEGGEKWSRPESPVLPSSPPPPPEPVEPPQEIYLEGALPAQSQLLVADSTTETETSVDSSSADPAVVLASKMTLSVISLDSQENENEVEPTEKSKLRNGEVENKNVEDEIVDESKYTTASGATAAERDISEEERTDGEEEMEDDIAKIPECMVDNGAQQIEDIEDLHDDDAEAELEKLADVKEEDVEKPQSTVKFSEEVVEDVQQKVNFLSPETIEGISDVIDDVINTGTQISELRSNLDEKVEEREPAVRFSEKVEDDIESEPMEGMSPADIESISDVIDDVINVGTRMSEMISAEKEAELNESVEAQKIENKTDMDESKEKEKKGVVEVVESDEEVEEEEIEIEVDEDDEEEIEVEIVEEDDDEEEVEVEIVEEEEEEEEEEVVELPKPKEKNTEKVQQKTKPLAESSDTKVETKSDSVND
ncbi:hypothetical protein ILUMI_24990 [Ignelater luminosus]|uniref:Resistance to inhibitors of cholinesterase protein 3 N-terminal domain-containing protein n=1 Tax=Ignelater luminosus TaxID=2038154 RepID=A0A8K0C5D3_IGNLU|nr:hypothetical protein ILUMI_24990 [Ignelater luminosus]